MKMNFIRFLLAASFFISSMASAGSFTIDANSAPYNTSPNAPGVGVISDIAERQNSMFALVGMHNTVNPGNKIEPGDVVTFKWQDGSSEKARVLNMFTPVGLVPIQGTQSMPAGGGRGYSTNSKGGYLGGSRIIGIIPIYSTVTACVGGYCETSKIVTGYRYITDVTTSQDLAQIDIEP